MNQKLSVSPQIKRIPIAGETWGESLDAFGGGEFRKIIAVKGGWIKYKYAGVACTQTVGMFTRINSFVRG